MSGAPFAKQRALRFSNGKALLVGDGSVPKRADIAHLFLRRKVVESWWNGDSICDEASLGPTGASDRT